MVEIDRQTLQLLVEHGKKFTPDTLEERNALLDAEQALLDMKMSSQASGQMKLFD